MEGLGESSESSVDQELSWTPQKKQPLLKICPISTTYGPIMLDLKLENWID